MFQTFDMQQHVARHAPEPLTVLHPFRQSTLRVNPNCDDDENWSNMFNDQPLDNIDLRVSEQKKVNALSQLLLLLS